MSDITVLGRLLRSLCHNTKWNYAVFWKLKQQGDVILAWEESCLHFPVVSSKVEDALHDGSFPVDRPSVIYPSFAEEAQDGPAFSVKTALLNLQYHQYPLGEGIIGKVSLTQRHHWIFSEESQSDLLSEYYEDWQLQFAAGIKTILLVPTWHFGVLQLGSLDTALKVQQQVFSHYVGSAIWIIYLHHVMEDPMLVIQIEELFGELLHYSGTSNISGTSIDCRDIFSLDERLPGNSSTSIIGLLNPIQSQQIFTMNPDILVSPLHDDVSEMLDSLLDPAATSYILNCSNNFLEVEDDISVTENEAKICLQSNVAYFGSNRKQFSCHTENEMHAAYDAISINEMTLQEAKEEHINAAKPITNGRLLGNDSRKHKVIGCASIEENGSSISNTTAPKAEESVFSTATLHSSKSYEQSFDKAIARLIEESDADYMVDNVFSSLQGAPTDYEIEELISRSFKYSSDKFMEPSSTLSKRDFNILGLTDSMLARQSKAEEIASSPESTSKRTCRLKCEYTDTTDNKYTDRKLSETTKRKGNIGIAQKPRPRDRQLIQDRIKELRELIPNGGKCSIDELLYKTVRHMLFLQSISVQAKKLRESSISEDIADWSSMSSQSYRPENQPQDCPLIFKNLHQPGQMLVEMLCKDYALFLEIVHTIRRLELVILTGALESRQHQGEEALWAHFIVEVPNGFNRVNILWPLMQLLQQNYVIVPNKP